MPGFRVNCRYWHFHYGCTCTKRESRFLFWRFQNTRCPVLDDMMDFSYRQFTTTAPLCEHQEKYKKPKFNPVGTRGK